MSIIWLDVSTNYRNSCMRRGMQVWHFPGGFFIAESARNHILHVSGSTFSAANYPGTLLYLASGRKDGLI